MLTQRLLQARPKGEHTDYQTSTTNQFKHKLELSAASTQHQAQKSDYIDPKLIQNRPKIDPRPAQNRPKIGFRGDFATGIVFGPNLPPIWAPSGVVLGVKLGSDWGHVGSEIDSATVPEGVQKRH